MIHTYVSFHRSKRQSNATRRIATSLPSEIDGAKFSKPLLGIDLTPALDLRADPRLLLECAHASSNPTTQIPKAVRAWISDAGGNALFLDALVPSRRQHPISR